MNLMQKYLKDSKIPTGLYFIFYGYLLNLSFIMFS